MGLAAISAIGFGQEVVKRSEFYQDPSIDLLAQFVIDVEGKSVSELKSSVELWAASAFVNTKEVTVAEGDNYIVYKPLLTYTYDSGLGVYQNQKITAHTKFEFKESKVRVTIIEHESLYIGKYTVKRTSWPTGGMWKDEYPNKGVWKANYRMMVGAIEEKNDWVNQIKNINFSSPEESSDW